MEPSAKEGWLQRTTQPLCVHVLSADAHVMECMWGSEDNLRWQS